MGARNANRLLQRAARSCGIMLVDDGVVGPKTIKAVNAADSRSMLTAFRSEAAGYYRTLVRVKPPFNKYINGWLKRAYT